MTKDGRETQWRQITEHDKPEMVALPDSLDEKYVPNDELQICIICLRYDAVNTSYVMLSSGIIPWNMSRVNCIFMPTHEP